LDHAESSSSTAKRCLRYRPAWWPGHQTSPDAVFAPAPGSDRASEHEDRPSPVTPQPLVAAHDPRLPDSLPRIESETGVVVSSTPRAVTGVSRPAPRQHRAGRTAIRTRPSGNGPPRTDTRCRNEDASQPRSSRPSTPSANQQPASCTGPRLDTAPTQSGQFPGRWPARSVGAMRVSVILMPQRCGSRIGVRFARGPARQIRRILVAVSTPRGDRPPATPGHDRNPVSRSPSRTLQTPRRASG
jgi:hypothetical protein